MRDEGERGEGMRARTHGCASACVRAWVRATRARDVHDDYSDIVVIVEGTKERELDLD